MYITLQKRFPWQKEGRPHPACKNKMMGKTLMEAALVKGLWFLALSAQVVTSAFAPGLRMASGGFRPKNKCMLRRMLKHKKFGSKACDWFENEKPCKRVQIGRMSAWTSKKAVFNFFLRRCSKSYISSTSSTLLWVGKMARNATTFRFIQWKMECITSTRICMKYSVRKCFQRSLCTAMPIAC